MDNPKVFYIVSNEKRDHFYHYLVNLYSTQRTKIYWESELCLETVKNFCPTERVSFYPIIFSPDDSYYQKIDDFLKINKRVELISVLSLGYPNSTFSGFHILFIGNNFKNGVKLQNNDYEITIENFILAGIHGENNIKNILRELPDSKHQPLPVCTFRIESPFLEKFTSSVSKTINTILEQSKKEGQKEAVNLEINIDPPKSKVLYELDQLFSKEVKDYLSIDTEEFDTTAFIEKKINQINFHILNNSLEEIKKEYLAIEEKTLEKLNKEKKELKNNIQEYLKNTNNVTFIRQTIEAEIRKIKKKIATPLNINHFSSELSKFLNTTKTRIKNNLSYLKEEIITLKKIKKKWKPYLIYPIIVSAILTLPFFLLNRNLLEFIAGTLQQVLFSFSILIVISFTLSFLIRYRKIRKQLKVCKNLLKDLKNVASENLLNSKIADTSYEIIKRKLDIKKAGNLLVDYQNLLGTLDNYYLLYKNYPKTIDSSFNQKSSLILKTNDESQISNIEESLRGALKVIYKKLWKFPDYKTLESDFLEIIIDITKKSMRYFSEGDSQQLLNIFNKALNNFYELLPDKKVFVSLKHPILLDLL